LYADYILDRNEILTEISKLYWKLLFRKPDEAGLQYYCNEIINDNLTLDELYSKILTCKERQSLEKKIKSFEISFFENKIYSQNGEDGILNFIFSYINTTNNFLVEIGCDDGSQCNGRLLLEAGWDGILIDSFGFKKIHKWQFPTMKNQLRKPLFPRNIPQHLLPYLKNEFVTMENIDEILKKYHVPKKIDLLSIDIDYNTFWIWKSIEYTRPRVVIVEYNSQIHVSESKVVKYDPDAIFDWTNYFGGSLLAFVKLAKEKNYDLVGCDTNGVNAFFITHEEIIEHNIPINDYSDLYMPPKFGDVWNEQYVGWPISNKNFEDY